MNDSRKIIELIFEIADKKKITMTELAERVGSAKSTLSRYKNNKRDFPINDIGKYAKVLNVPVEYLLGLETSNQITNEYNYFPQSISAGLPFIADGITNFDTIAIPDELMGKYAGHDDIIISKINGDSMDRLMKDGSFIAIKPIALSELKNGDMVVFSNEYEYSVKYFYQTDDKLIFKPYSHNNCHHEQHYELDANITIHGKVVTYIVNLD